MAHIYKKDQGCDWESEISNDKIIAVMPHAFLSVIVSYVDDDGETKEVICDKISFV